MNPKYAPAAMTATTTIAAPIMPRTGSRRGAGSGIVSTMAGATAAGAADVAGSSFPSRGLPLGFGIRRTGGGATGAGGGPGSSAGAACFHHGWVSAALSAASAADVSFHHGSGVGDRFFAGRFGRGVGHLLRDGLRGRRRGHPLA